MLADTFAAITARYIAVGAPTDGIWVNVDDILRDRGLTPIIIAGWLTILVDRGRGAMRAEEAAALYTLLAERDVRVWVDGGWGVDALLGKQTRPHKDFDALAPLEDLGALAAVLDERGFTLKELWGENRWVAHPARLPLIGGEEGGGSAVATAFVVRDDAGRELDLHALTLDGRGAGIPAWRSQMVYPPAAFAGRGVIAGTPVRCLSARMQMATHTGYPLQAKDLQDLRLLHERFGVAYLPEQARRVADRA